MAAVGKERNRRVLTSAQQPELNQLMSDGSSSDNDSDSESDARFARKRAQRNAAGGEGGRAKGAAGRKDVAASNDVENAAGSKARSKIAGANDATTSGGANRPEWSAPRMSAEELTSHYEQCIKLSATNKINAKNAFSLHLIEFMSELLRKNVNFQVASSTLHAGAKIYASRVDAVHKNTIRVRSGLSGNPQDDASSSSSEEDEQNADVDGDQNGAGTKARNKPKRKKKKVLLASGEAQRIRQKRPEAHLQIDPLFRLHAAEFNEAGVEALFANRYDFSETQPFACFSTDANAIVMHTADSWRTALHRNYRNLRATDATDDTQSQRLADDESNERPMQFQMPDSIFNETLRAAVGDDATHICPHFRTFEFNARDSQLDFVDRLLHTDTERTQEQERGVANEQFDWLNDDNDRYRALPPPSRADDSDDAMPDAGYASPGSDDEQRSHLVGMAAEQLENTNGQGMAQLVATMIREGNTTSLSRILADKPSDFTFFDSSMLRLWAGPAHWRMRNPFNKMPADANEPAANMAATKKKDPAAAGNKNRRIDFFADTNTLAAAFKKSRSTTLSEAALSKQERASTTLPEYAHYEPRMLTCAFLKAAHRFDRATPHGDADETLVPTGPAPGADLSDDDHVPAVDGSLPDDDAFNAYDGSMIQTDGHNWLLVDGADDEGRQNVVRAVELDRILDSQPQSQVPGASAAGADPQANLNQTLVAAPQRVAKMDINYTRVARHVDVPCVKRALWFLIRRNAKAHAPPDGAPRPPSPRSNAQDSRPGAGEPNNNKQTTFSCTFADLIAQLPSCVPAKVTESLNSPIIFVCLLHLTNEKSLYLRKHDDLGNFDILLEPEAETGAVHDQTRVRSPRARPLSPRSAARQIPVPIGEGRVGRAANKHARKALTAQADAELSSEGESLEAVKKKKKRVLAV